MTKFEEEFDNNVEIFDVIGNHNSMCCEVDQVKEVFKDWQPQQALPVVPECVGNMIEYAKKTEKTIRWFFTEDAYMFPEAMDWYAGSVKGLVDDIYGERQCSLINAFITGKYEVEKTQLFYLKNKLTTSYLALDTKTGYYEHWGEEIIPKLPKKQGYKIAFTQQEIDNMDAGSYEQIGVTEK